MKVNEMKRKSKKKYQLFTWSNAHILEVSHCFSSASSFSFCSRNFKHWTKKWNNNKEKKRKRKRKRKKKTKQWNQMRNIRMVSHGVTSLALLTAVIVTPLDTFGAFNAFVCDIGVWCGFSVFSSFCCWLITLGVSISIRCCLTRADCGGMIGEKIFFGEGSIINYSFSFLFLFFSFLFQILTKVNNSLIQQSDTITTVQKEESSSSSSPGWSYFLISLLKSAETRLSSNKYDWKEWKNEKRRN